MVGLVIATHGHLAQELISTAMQIVGPMPNTVPCSIEPGSSPEDISAKMQKAISEVETGEGVIVLADLVGGTPCNQSLMLCQTHHLEVLTGVNLPMLLKAHSLRDEHMELPTMAATLASYGQKNILCATDRIRDAQNARGH
jgi:PTS system mannose-specific IIA component